MVFLTASLVAALVLAQRGCGQAAPPDISHILEPIRKSHNLPALAGAVVTRDGLECAGAVGVRRYGNDTPVMPNDSFHLGSCTKAMTATLIATLVEEGKLSWNTTLQQAFPEISDAIHPAYRLVTLEQMLAHRAGFPADPWPSGMGFLDTHRLTGTPREQRWSYVKRILSEKPAAVPGSQYIYSNRGYAVAGCIAERVLDAPFEKLMSDRLFRPLGMSSAGFGAMGRAGTLDQPRQHTLSDGKPKPIEPGATSDNPPAIAPAGTVHCSVVDWAAFIRAHLMEGRKADGLPALLKPASFAKLHSPWDASDYGFGWAFADREWGGGRVLTHAGSNNQNYALVWMSVVKGFAVLVMTNIGGDDAAQACDEAAGALIRWHQK